MLQQDPSWDENSTAAAEAQALAVGAKEEASDRAGRQVERLEEAAVAGGWEALFLSWYLLDPALWWAENFPLTAQGSRTDPSTCSAAAEASCAQPGDREGTRKYPELHYLKSWWSRRWKKRLCVLCRVLTEPMRLERCLRNVCTLNSMATSL